MPITSKTAIHPTPGHYSWDDTNRVVGYLAQLGLTRQSTSDPWGKLETDLLRCDFWAWDDATSKPKVIGTRHTGGKSASGQVYGITDYTFTRGRTSVTEHASPMSCTFTVVGHLLVADDNPAAPAIEVGQGVRVYFPADAPGDGANTTASFVGATAGSTQAQTDAKQSRFVGQVTDLGDISIDPLTQTVSMPVTCSGLLARLGNTSVSVNYAAASSTMDNRMVQDVLQAAWNADNGVRVGLWATAANLWADAVTTAVPSMAVGDWTDTASAADLLNTLADTVGAELMEKRSGQIRWLTPATRAALPVSLDLAVDQVLAPIVFGQHIGDVVNVMDVGYGDNNTVTCLDQRSVRRRGKLSASIQTHLPNAAAARARGNDLVWRRGRPSWSVPTVTVDLTELMRQAVVRRQADAAKGNYPNINTYPEWALVKKLVLLDVGEPVRLNSLPTNSPIRAGGFYCDGIVERLTPGRWTLDLTLIPYGQLAFPQKWSDLTAAAYAGTWSAMDPDMSWEQATAWAPDPFPYGTWDGQPGNLWWSSVRYNNANTAFKDWTGH